MFFWFIFFFALKKEGSTSIQLKKILWMINKLTIMYYERLTVIFMWEKKRN